MTFDTSAVPEGLQLARPKFITYHSAVDPSVETPPNSSDTAAQRQTSSGYETYNGIPLRTLGKAQNLIEDGIRLLDLFPGIPGAPLMGSLRKVKLSGHHVYEPLSYTWEDHPTDVTSQGDGVVHPVLFLDYDPCVYIDLHINCARALHRIRDIATIRTFWVDAVCINQDNLDERSQKVALIHRIYTRPLTVVAYVGHKSKEHHSSTAMWLLKHPATLNAGMLNDCQSSSIDYFILRPYFQRMWIVQECALATSLRLICGPDEVVISKFTHITLDMLVASKRTAIPAWLKHSLQLSGKHVQQEE